MSRCMCSPGYYGDHCQYLECLNNCSYPHGTCDSATGVCACEMTYSPYNNTRQANKVETGVAFSHVVGPTFGKTMPQHVLCRSYGVRRRRAERVLLARDFRSLCHAKTYLPFWPTSTLHLRQRSRAHLTTFSPSKTSVPPPGISTFSFSTCEKPFSLVKHPQR